MPVHPQFLGPGLRRPFGLPVPAPFDASGARHLWFHAAALGGNLPTDVYHAVPLGLAGRGFRGLMRGSGRAGYSV